MVHQHNSPGKIVLIGSGETSRIGGQVFERLIKSHGTGSRIVVLETPAGFELNSQAVAGRVTEYLRKRLVNEQPVVEIVAARARDTAFSPDDPNIVRPLSAADLIFLGPGSPTYTVRQLRSSLAWELIRARFWQGASLVLASAAAISIGRYALPVYEIYKVGEELHWVEGLDFFGQMGLRLAIITHWNNHEGGAELDTSHCFMGEIRFDRLRKILPADITILGVDEQTALHIDLPGQRCEVMGVGQVHVLRHASSRHYATHSEFALSELGTITLPAEGQVWSEETRQLLAEAWQGPEQLEIPEDILLLARERHRARMMKEWQLADDLRKKLESLGWVILDTSEGFQLGLKT